MNSLKKAHGISLMIIFLLGKSVYGMEDDIPDKSQKRQVSYTESDSLEKDLKEIEAEIYQRLVAHQIDHDGVWRLLAGCYQKYFQITSCDNTHESLVLWAMQMAVHYRLPLITKLILLFPEAVTLPRDVVKDLLSLMVSSRNNIFPRAIKVRIFYQLIKLPQIKKFTEAQIVEVVSNLLDEKIININTLQAIFSHFSNFFTPAS